MACIVNMADYNKRKTWYHCLRVSVSRSDRIFRCKAIQATRETIYKCRNLQSLCNQRTKEKESIWRTHSSGRAWKFHTSGNAGDRRNHKLKKYTYGFKLSYYLQLQYNTKQDEKALTFNQKNARVKQTNKQRKKQTNIETFYSSLFVRHKYNFVQYNR